MIFYYDNISWEINFVQELLVLVYYWCCVLELFFASELFVSVCMIALYTEAVCGWVLVLFT